jgi:hypothetical protein
VLWFLGGRWCRGGDDDRGVTRNRVYKRKGTPDTARTSWAPRADPRGIRSSGDFSGFWYVELGDRPWVGKWTINLLFGEVRKLLPGIQRGEMLPMAMLDGAESNPHLPPSLSVAHCTTPIASRRRNGKSQEHLQQVWQDSTLQMPFVRVALKHSHRRHYFTARVVRLKIASSR